MSALHLLVTWLNELCMQENIIIQSLQGQANIEVVFQDTRYVFAPAPAHLVPFLVKSDSRISELKTLLDPLLRITNIYGGMLEHQDFRPDTTFSDLFDAAGSRARECPCVYNACSVML